MSLLVPLQPLPAPVLARLEAGGFSSRVERDTFFMSFDSYLEWFGTATSGPRSASRDSQAEQYWRMIYCIAASLCTTRDDVHRSLVAGVRSTNARGLIARMSAVKYESVAWHIPDESQRGTGYCYLSVIRCESRREVSRKLGKYPTVLQLVFLPWNCFNSLEELDAMDAVTDDMSRPVPAVRAVSVLQMLYTVARAYHQFVPAGSMCGKLRESRFPGLHTVDLSPLDVVGGETRKWHVTTDNEGFSSTYPSGYCYEHLFKHRLRLDTAREVGAMPSIRELLALPRRTFRDPSSLRRVLFVSHDGTSPEAYSAKQVFSHAARAIDDHVEGSLGEHFATRISPRDYMGAEFPAVDDIVGTATQQRASAFTMVVPRRRVYTPPITPSDAELVFENSMVAWRLDPEDALVADELLTAFAEVLVTGSSDRVFDRATVKVVGVRLALSVFMRELRAVVNADNALRLWVRSFREAQMCLRISELLANPVNNVLRQRAAYCYKASMDYVHLCFDTVRTYGRVVGGLRYTERVFIRVAKQLKFTALPSDGLLEWLGDSERCVLPARCE